MSEFLGEMVFLEDIDIGDDSPEDYSGAPEGMILQYQSASEMRRLFTRKKGDIVQLFGDCTFFYPKDGGECVKKLNIKSFVKV